MKVLDIICIIDDDDIYQFTVRKFLSSKHVAKRLQFFENGKEAIEHFRTFSESADELADVILLDINMPIMDGWGFLKEYSRIKDELVKKTHIFMVSSSIDEADIARAKQISELSGYYVKPINEEQLISILANFSQN